MATNVENKTSDQKGGKSNGKVSLKKEMITRFFYFYVATIVFGFIPVGMQMYHIMEKEGDFWRELGKQSNKIEDIEAQRGNILACDGKVLAATVPTYRLSMDFKADGLTQERFDTMLSPLCDSLGPFFGMTPDEMKAHLKDGYRKGSRNFLINKKKLSYVELKRVKEFPLFNLGSNKSGLIYKSNEQVTRSNPFRPNSQRTIGSLYSEKDKGGKCGIEQYYNDILKGEAGKSQTVYVGRNRYKMPIIDPIEGKDVMTTLDVDIMDITDNALRDKLVEVNAAKGCAVIMEVKTGQIKAMSNLKRTSDGDYEEVENFAINSVTEPGSTFKIASAMIALEDGTDTSKVVDTENGTWKIYGQTMRDWNYNKGGYGKISLNRGIQVSSNIAIAKIIEEKYSDNPKKFIEGLYKMGLNTPLNLELSGIAKPYIKHPTDKTWSKTSLPWIAHGYELIFPPINVLTFYNGIANGGKMIQPYLVKGIYYNGTMIENKERVNVINNKLCSDKTLGKIRTMMEDVVELGTARNVRSEHFKIAGKTGTAVQKYNGRRSHQLTFCGYFPADNPKYSMIVVVWYPQNVYPSAGAISGEVFKTIAERVYAISPLTRTYMDDVDMTDEEHLSTPITKDGNYKDLLLTLNQLDIKYTEDEENGNTSGWCRTEALKNVIRVYNQRNYNNRVPNVIGMGAKDAVFLMENRGLKVKISGIGAVYSQSLPPGEAITKGTTVTLLLK